MPVPPPRPTPRTGPFLAWAPAGVLSIVHGWLVWVSMGGWEAISSSWPPSVHDHPTYFHSALITRHFLRQSMTTAGYDPAFMAGYPKSIVFPASSTLWEVLFALDRSGRPELTYKLGMFLFVASLPWLVATAGGLLRLGPGSTFVGVGWYLVYLWNDFPINYAVFGMVPYQLAIPMALLTTATLARYVERGGFRWWLGAAVSLSLVLLVHFTSLLIIAPATAWVWLVSLRKPAESKGFQEEFANVVDPKPLNERSKTARRRLLGFVGIGLVALAVNAFWWWPGLWLASTKGVSDFVFAEKTSVLVRLARIIGKEPRIQLTLWLLGPIGLFLLARRDRIVAASLIGFAAAGFGWGYLSGVSRSLDFLQLGRHTYALYTALAMGAGVFVVDFIAWMDRIQKPIGGLILLALVVGAAIEFWVFKLILNPLAFNLAILIGATVILVGLAPLFRRRWSVLGVQVSLVLLAATIFEFWTPATPIFRQIFRPLPFLSSKPSAQLLWVVNRVRAHVRPGERLLYEEGGFQVEGLADPYGYGRYSGLLPHLTGVEVLGGPYLHAALQTNFTQFGEAKLFEKENWTEADFRAHARLYRPSAILCWTPWSRRFCYQHPELIEIKEDDGLLTIGRVKGYEGSTIQGRAEVIAEPGRLRVRGMAGELDGLVVLRYHFVPCLRSRPSVALVPVLLEDDPVPFIGLRPTAGEVTIEMAFPP